MPINPFKHIPKTKVIEILKVQCDLYPNINIKIKNLDFYSLIKQNWLEDLIFEKFGLESEEYCSVPGLEKSKEFAKAAKR
jgi:hypothetical protein